jgi:hypothetical protein
MGQEIEQKIRDVIAGGFAGTLEHLRREGPQLLFTWLALIFLKTHLKDKSLNYRRGPGCELETISDHYSWAELHHIHCMARSFFTRCNLDHRAFGSLLVLPAKTGAGLPRFDYTDLYAQRTVLLRLDEIAFVTVLNDSGGALNLYTNQLKRISGPLSPVQLREVMAEMGFLNDLMKERPTFCTKADFESERCWIEAQRPSSLETVTENWEDFGAILYSVIRDMIAGSKIPDPQEVKRQVRKGVYSFLWDRDGQFIKT